MSKQPEALRLAEEVKTQVFFSREEVAAELIRLHEVNQELLEALELIANTEHFDAVLDPQRSIRVARAAIVKPTQGE